MISVKSGLHGSMDLLSEVAPETRELPVFLALLPSLPHESTQSPGRAQKLTDYICLVVFLRMV
jgi:hypothetical protein